jgi:hypothetical protein
VILTSAVAFRWPEMQLYRTSHFYSSLSVRDPCFKSIQHNIHITAKAALKFESETWVLKKREEQRLEAAQMKFSRHLLGMTEIGKEKTNVLGKKRDHRI